MINITNMRDLIDQNFTTDITQYVRFKEVNNTLYMMDSLKHRSDYLYSRHKGINTHRIIQQTNMTYLTQGD